MNFEEFWAANRTYKQTSIDNVEAVLSRFWRYGCRRDFSDVINSDKSYANLGPVFPGDQSSRRVNGLAMWDTILTRKNPIEARQFATSSTPIKPEPMFNKLWTNSIYTQERKRYLYDNDIDLPAYLDFSKEFDGFTLYKAAHVLAHLWGDPVAVCWPVDMQRYVYKKFFDTAVANILMSWWYSIPIYIKAAPFDKHWEVPSALGIRYTITDTYEDPLFYIKKQDILSLDNFDKTLANVFIVVYTQAHVTKEAIANPASELLYNMGPMRALFVGWELLDFVLIQANAVTRGYKKKPHIVVHPEDLHSPEHFAYYLEAVNYTVSDGYMGIHTWLNSGEYLEALSQTPPLPCRACLTQTRDTEEYIQKPSTPEEIKRDKAQRTAIFKATRSYTRLKELCDTGKSSEQLRTINSRRTKKAAAKLKNLKKSYKIIKNNDLIL